MFCSKCGKENPDNAKFCSGCGAVLETEMPKTENVNFSGENQGGEFVSPVLNLFGKIFNDKLFMVICILMTVSTGMSIVSGSVPIIHLLATIFLWLIYSAAKKGTIDVKNMRRVSGCVYAEKVVGYVESGILAVVGVLVFLLGVAMGATEIFSDAVESITDAVPGALNIPNFEAILSLAPAIIGIVLIIAAVIVFVITKICVGPLHTFAKSLYSSVADNRFCLMSVKSAKTWCLVIGILNGIAALSSVALFGAFIANGSFAAVLIITYILIGKYLENIEQ